MAIPSSASHIGSRMGMSMHLCSISVLGPALHWTQDVPFSFPSSIPSFQASPMLPFLKAGDRDVQGNLSPQLVRPNLVWSDLSEVVPKAWTAFSQRMGRGQ
jgi:hypothetical protein